MPTGLTTAPAAAKRLPSGESAQTNCEPRVDEAIRGSLSRRVCFRDRSGIDHTFSRPEVPLPLTRVLLSSENCIQFTVAAWSPNTASRPPSSVRQSTTDPPDGGRLVWVASLRA